MAKIIMILFYFFILGKKLKLYDLSREKRFYYRETIAALNYELQ